MKSLICLLAVVSAVVAMPQHADHIPQSRALRQNSEPNAVAPPPVAASPSPAAPAAAPAARPAAPARPALGPNFFGPGLNNPRALPTNPHQIRVAQEVFKTNPNLRALVLPNGEIEFTNQFGQSVDVEDAFGNDPLEILSPIDRFKQQQEIAQHRREQAQLQAQIQAQEQFLQQLSQAHASRNAVFNPAALGAPAGTPTGTPAGTPPASNFNFGQFAGFEGGIEAFEELAELRARNNFQRGQTGAAATGGAGGGFFVRH